MYIFQRASPGLYELFQTYRKKAEVEFGAALKTCEDMEAVMRRGGDPYEDWIKMAKGENWKTENNTSRDAVTSKTTVERNAGKDGVTWIGGIKKGGFAQGPIEVVHDIVQAGYNVTMNQAPGASPTTVFPSTGPGATRLTQAFASPATAADWAVAVIGDKLIATCDEVGCPAKGSSPGTGLLPKFEAEKPTAQAQLQRVVTAAVPDRADLDAASAPGVVITRELVDAIRDMRPVERDVAVARLSMEVAQARTIDRALLIRNTFLTGAGVPEATYESAQKEVREKVDQINRYIDDLLFETRVRREVVSNTATALIDSYRGTKAASTNTGTKPRVDQNPLSDGRVQ
jgi:integrating conjugative element protein (TIGR03755 family)